MNVDLNQFAVEELEARLELNEGVPGSEEEAEAAGWGKTKTTTTVEWTP